MSERIHVATRKGLFVVERDRTGRWEPTRSAFLGDPVTMLLDDARDGTLYAALNLGHFGVKLHRSSDRGGTWEEVRCPAYPKAPEPAPETAAAAASAPAVQQIWALAAGGADEPGCLWAGTIPGGLFRSTDRGGSWELNAALWNRPERQQWFGGGYDQAGIHSICVDPRDARRVVVGVSCGGVWLTEDGGASWEVRTRGMFAAYMPEESREDPAIQDPHRLAWCRARPEAMWVQHHNGIFRTVDGGRQWKVVEDVAPSTFGFAVAVHPTDPDTAWFAPAQKDECRIPVNGRVVVTRTRDGGSTFDVLAQGLPQKSAYDLVYRHALDIDAGGERLAMGSTTGSLWVSEDQGDRWQCVSTHLPPIYQVEFERTE